MSKFVIECPNCGRFAEARSGFFARKKIDCACGFVINVRTDRLTSHKCAHCGNDVVFDQSRGDKAKCPVCHENINELSDKTKVEEFSCAQCGVKLIAAKNANTYTCPVCDCVNDVQMQLMQEKIKHDGLASIIKYEGDNDTLIWKHPIEDFNLGSQLIVHESQEAVFFRDGQALDTFGPGRYTLETQQLPILEKLYKLPTDTDGTFHSEVYFINKTVQMAIKWGTPDNVWFIDPLTGTPLELGASGEMNIAVDNGRKLLIKLVGTMGIAWGDGAGFTKSLQASFRQLIVNAVKVNLPAVIEQNEIDILEIDEKLDIISDSLCGKIKAGFEEYGLTIPQFYVMQIVLPENDPNFKRIRYLNEGIGDRGPDISSGGSSVFGDIMGIGIGMAAVQAVVPQMGTMLSGMNPTQNAAVENSKSEPDTSTGWDCPSCGNKGIKGKFCNECGARKPEPKSDDTWDCACGYKNIIGKFCNMCGAKKPEKETWDCACGNKGIKGKFCNECGSKKPEKETWDCACGNKNIIGKFCNMCGSKKTETKPATWDCECGNKGIAGMFCNNCGKKRGD